MKFIILFLSLSLCGLAFSQEEEADSEHAKIKSSLVTAQSYLMSQTNPSYQITLRYGGENFYTGLYDILSSRGVSHFMLEMELAMPNQKCTYKCTARNYEDCGYFDIRFCKIIQKSIQKKPQECRLPGKYIDKWGEIKSNVIFDPNSFRTCSEKKGANK